jgi:uncharacterized protein (DUF924 family)
MTPEDTARIDAVLNFWFGPIGPDGTVADEKQSRWFDGGSALDEAIRRRFGEDLERASRGELDGWALEPRGRLALVVLLDQFSRNVYRGEARAFANDARALALCLEGIARGDDAALTPLERIFLYLPLEHAEDRTVQGRSCEHVAALAASAPAMLRPTCDDFLAYAVRHRDVIERFGRFPHRNAVLGRASTPDEIAFLRDHAAGF